MPAKKDLPSTLQRSSKKAQRTWGKTHDAAVEQYGEGERAHRTAFDSLKHSFEKVGDHWEAKDEKGPSDAQAAKSGPAARTRHHEDGRRRRRERHEGPPDGRGEEARRPRPLADDQGRAGRGDPEGQRPRDAQEPLVACRSSDHDQGKGGVHAPQVVRIRRHDRCPSACVKHHVYVDHVAMA